MQIELNDKTILDVADDPVDIGGNKAFLIESDTSLISPRRGRRGAYLGNVERGLNPTVTYVNLFTDGEPDLDDISDRWSMVLEDVVITRIS